MGLSRWLLGNRNEALDPRDEGSKFIPGSYKSSGTDSGRQVNGSDSSNVDVVYSKDWQEVIRSSMADLSADFRVVLVTDVLGIEVSPNELQGGYLSRDRFPLRLRCTNQPALQLQRRNSKGSTRSPPSSQDPQVNKHTTQISLQIQFADLWPGILKVKLDQQGFTVKNGNNDHLQFLVATDSTGVELDLKSSRARLPSPERFPLKLHFRTPRSGPQNLVIKDEHEKQKYEKNDKAEQAMLFEHSTELKLSGLLSDIVDSKLEDIGLCVNESDRSLVLLTDCLGVVIKPADGVPDRSRFPIKVHIERSIMTSLEQFEEEKRGWNPFLEKIKNARKARLSAPGDMQRAGSVRFDFTKDGCEDRSRWSDSIFRPFRKTSKEPRSALAHT